MKEIRILVENHTRYHGIYSSVRTIISETSVLANSVGAEELAESYIDQAMASARTRATSHSILYGMAYAVANGLDIENKLYFSPTAFSMMGRNKIRMKGIGVIKAISISGHFGSRIESVRMELSNDDKAEVIVEYA